jgi:hypothetical protein
MRSRMVTLTVTVLGILSLFLGEATAKTQDTAILHVTSVRQDEAKDWCDTEKCFATRFTVEGHRAARNPNQVIKYVLECVEMIPTETGKRSLICPRVQADGDYDVNIFTDAVGFPSAELPKNGLLSFYTIKSQKVENK